MDQCVPVYVGLSSVQFSSVGLHALKMPCDPVCGLVVSSYKILGDKWWDAQEITAE